MKTDRPYKKTKFDFKEFPYHNMLLYAIVLVTLVLVFYYLSEIIRGVPLG